MLSAHFNYAASHITRNVASASRAHTKAVEQIATGSKINVGADGPADLIQSEKLRSQIEGLERAIRNTSESNNILGIMDGALGQVQNIVTRMSGLAIEAANSGIVSPDRVAANQAEIDSGLQAIERIIETTNYGGKKLLAEMQERGVIDHNYINALEAGKTLEKNEGRLPEGAYTRDDKPGKLFLIADDQEHEAQISKDGKTLGGDKTFVLPPAEEGGEPTELTFAEGASLGDIVSALRERGLDYLEVAVPQKGEPILVGDFGDRLGKDINTVEIDNSQLLALAFMSDKDAQAALAGHMNDFTRELELDIAGWNKLSDADKSLLMTADHFKNLKLDDLGGLDNGSGDRLTLNDLYSGKKASLLADPAAAIGVLDKARKSVTAERAGIAATQAMAVHGMNSDEATLEALTRTESSIRDTQINEAVVEKARTEILQQTGMTLLRQAMDQDAKNIADLLDLTA